VPTRKPVRKMSRTIERTNRLKIRLVIGWL
jgi:hypothetical protein